MKVDRRGGGRLHRVGSLPPRRSPSSWPSRWPSARRRRRALLAAGGGREKLPGHQGLVPPGATLVGPAPTSTSLPLTVTLKPRDPAALAAEAQAVSDPQFARVPPLPDAGAVRAGVRADAGHHRPGQFQPPAGGADGRARPRRPACRCRCRARVAQVQSAFSTPISKYRLSSGKTGYDNATAPEVDDLGGAADRGHPRARHAQPPATVDERSRGEPGLGARRQPTRPRRRWRQGSPARPEPAAPTASRGVIEQHGSARCTRAGPGLRVRSPVLVGRLRGGQHRGPRRDVGGGLLRE